MLGDISILLTAGVATAAAAIFGWLLVRERIKHSAALIDIGSMREQLKDILSVNSNLLDELHETAVSAKHFSDEYRKILSQKKSSEVRVGKIGENLAPFLNGWPYDPNSFRFLGNPIDGIQFADDKIRFVEIKTGKARLSASQKWIKDLVKKGQVSFVTFRVGEDGCTLIEDEMEI